MSWMQVYFLFLFELFLVFTPTTSQPSLKIPPGYRNITLREAQQIQDSFLTFQNHNITSIMFNRSNDVIRSDQSHDRYFVCDGSRPCLVGIDQQNRLRLRIAVISQGEMQGSPVTEAERNRIRNIGYPNDDCGHVTGRQLGGFGNDSFNTFPQHPGVSIGLCEKLFLVLI